MPQYTFRCPTCGAEFDRFLRLSELSRGAVCPTCQATVQHPSGGGPAAAQAPSSAPGQGSCLIPQGG